MLGLGKSLLQTVTIPMEQVMARLEVGQICLGVFRPRTRQTNRPLTRPPRSVTGGTARVDRRVVDDYEQGLDIGQPDVVAKIATGFGLEPLDAESTGAAVRADWDEGKARGVVGSPHFFAGETGGWFCPALAISRDDVGNFIVAWKQGNEAFVSSVFS